MHAEETKIKELTSAENENEMQKSESKKTESESEKKNLKFDAYVF